MLAIVTPPERSGEEHPARSPTTGYTPRQRWRALAILAGIGMILFLVSFGDALSSLIPRTPYRPSQQQAGVYHVTLRLDPDQPQVGQPLLATLTVMDARGQAVRDATVAYQWTMPTMLMEPITGMAAPQAAIDGTYHATILPTMTGSWQLIVSVHTPSIMDAATTFDIPVR